MPLEIAGKVEDVKFNMGLATLENINNLLSFYHKLSIFDMVSTTKGSFKLDDTLECQRAKSRTCNQLLIASNPLLQEKQKQPLKTKLEGTKLKDLEIKNGAGKVIKKFAVYSPIVDKACDDFVLELEDILQENKVFMPGKGESSLF